MSVTPIFANPHLADLAGFRVEIDAARAEPGVGTPTTARASPSGRTLDTPDVPPGTEGLTGLRDIEAAAHFR